MKIFKIAVLVSAMVLTGCANTKDSWSVYCKKYGVNPNNPTEKQENFYLDCYAGSVEEEIDMSGKTAIYFTTDCVQGVVREVYGENEYFAIDYYNNDEEWKYLRIPVEAETAMKIAEAMSDKSKLVGYLVMNKCTGKFKYIEEL